MKAIKFNASEKEGREGNSSDASTQINTHWGAKIEIQEMAKEVMFRASLDAYYTPKSIIEFNSVAWDLFW